jgi:hypothetical protein
MISRADRVKATMELPKDLWRRVRRAALDENVKAWNIVTEALEDYLDAREKYYAKGGGSRPRDRRGGKKGGAK